MEEQPPSEGKGKQSPPNMKLFSGEAHSMLRLFVHRGGDESRSN